MLGPVDSVRGLTRRISRLIHEKVRAFRRWIETTHNLIHLSVLLALPLLLGSVTALSNAIDLLPFLLFPPLASGSYTLFSSPESRSASPRRFVGGLTAGAFCGWIALELALRYWYQPRPQALAADPAAVALGLFLTGVVTWALDIEEASAFSTALLVHVTGADQFAYVLSVAASSALVAAAFVLWRDNVYEQRANILYESTRGDDHVLVPTGGPHEDATAMLGARLAAAHDAGKVVLCDVVADEDIAAQEQALLEGRGEPVDEGIDAIVPQADPTGVQPGDVHQNWADFERESPDHSQGVDAGDISQDWDAYDADTIRERARDRAVAVSAATLESRAERIERDVGVPCEVVVAAGSRSRARTISRTARETGCDLIVASYETDNGDLAPSVRELFESDIDVLVHRSADERARWSRVLVLVRRASDVAHAMIDFATRLTGDDVSLCRCIDAERERRDAEEMLANLAGTADGNVETRVARDDVVSFLEANAAQFDLVVLGSSGDRSAASRFLTPPTYGRLGELDIDVAILDRGR
ncbi:Nucleotide-binding protein, UspA family [Halapricum desulfuricans]|uniref:Nucleotide-binding protein, UspA family n=1 Tax=Halapricum desulfuricans TaxID=2841257 RepID=A0A897NCT4_9EURY|nr:HPP family protein [Halapricum desulfuricans]QSG12220.1 Nucleotide-binding protein, UspA family [Halapricum desulfuricans]